MRKYTSDQVRVSLITDALTEIENYLQSIDFEVFNGKSILRYACIKQLELVGNLCEEITDETKFDFPKVEWKQLSELNRLFAHESLVISNIILWEIITKNLINTKKQFNIILSEIQS